RATAISVSARATTSSLLSSSRKKNDRRSGGSRESSERLPFPPVESLQRPVPALVVHLRVAVDPVTQVQVVAPVAPRPRQLLQDRQRAQRARLFVRIEEGVHRRQRGLADQVGHRDAEQAVAAMLAQLHEAPLRPAADEELVEL